MEWGKEIPVNGVRPTWLTDDDKTLIGWRGRPAAKWSVEGAWSPKQISSATDDYAAWHGVAAIRLPADHFAYLAIDNGFEPWGGGDAAPDDWDGGDVLRRGGASTRPEPWAAPYAHNQRWSHYLDGRQGRFADIIGYRKRAIADTVTIARTTEAEACRRYSLLRENGDEPAIALLHELGLIREETTAERFTRETGITITPEIEKALSWNR